MTDTDYSEEVSDIVDALEAKFQQKLISGSNIKTINNTSILGSGNISISGGGGSFEPELVYSCSNFNSTYINTGATNRLQLYKLGSIYFIRYFITTKTLTYASQNYNINDDTISSEYRPSGDITFHIPTSSDHNAKLTIGSNGKVRISADTDSTSISFAGTNMYWWAGVVPATVSLSLSSSSITYGGSVTLSATITQSGSAVAGETVTFYDGSTSLGTATTNSSGVATLTKSDFNAGSHSLTAVYGDVSSTDVSLTVAKATPTISLSAQSSTITYGNNAVLSGTLSIGSGISVKIYNGNTLVDTVTTGTGGAFSKTVSGLNVGTHSFTAVFEGNTNYNNVTSSAVSVNVSKITSTISLSTSSASVTYGTSVTLSGTLSVGSGKSVELYDGNTLVDTLTTTTNGAFSYSSSSLSVGSHSFIAVYDGDSTHTSVTSSSVSVTVQAAPSYDSIDLTSDKSIISYADGESATLTAQLQENGSDAHISGVSLSFVIKKGSTVIDTKTATTGADGSCSVSYVGQGTGDINIQVTDGSILSKTYSIQDRTFYDASSSSNLSKYSIPTTGVTMTYDNTNKCYNCTVTISGTRTVILNNLTLSKHCKIQADINMINTSNTQPRLGLWNGNTGITSRAVLNGTSKYFGVSSQNKGTDGTNIDIHSGVGISANTWYTLEVTYNNGTVTARILNGTTVIDTITGSESVLSNSNEFGIDIGFGTNANFKIKNIMIQEL